MEIVRSELGPNVNTAKAAPPKIGIELIVLSPLPPNRAGGSPAHGSPVDALNSMSRHPMSLNHCEKPMVSEK